MTDPSIPARAALLETVREMSAYIETRAADSEQQQTMPRDVVDLLQGAGLFQLMVPTEFGGHGADVVTLAEVVEEVSRADGSTGWTLMANACSAGTFSAYLSDEAVKEVYAGSTPAIVSLAPAPFGTAVRSPDDDGYLVRARHSFGSGSGHATWIGGGCEYGVDGESHAFLYLAPARDVELLGNWEVLGLVGTGSFDFGLDDVFIPDAFTFPFFDAKAQRGQPSLTLGIQGVALAGHLGVATGTAKRAIEEVVKVVDGGKARFGSAPIREQDLFLHDFAKQEGLFSSTRAFAFESFASALDTITAGDPISTLQFQRLVQSTVVAVESAADMVRWCYTWSGSAGLRNPSPLGRCMRDMLAQTQHFMIETNWLIGAGREVLSAYRADQP